MYGARSLLTCSDGNAMTHLSNLLATLQPSEAYREGATNAEGSNGKVGVATNGNTGGGDRAAIYRNNSKARV